MASEKVVRYRSRRWVAVIAIAVGLLSLGLAMLAWRSRFDVYRHPASDLLVLGEAALEEGRFDVALRYFERAEADGGELPSTILLDCAESSLQLGATSKAEAYLTELLAREPNHVTANELLCGILRVSGRNWEVRSHALALMRQDLFSAGNLVALTTSDLATKRGSPADTDLEMFILERAIKTKAIPVRLAEARFFLGHNEHAKALPLLRGIVAEDPKLLDAQAWLGSLLLSTGALRELLQWHESLPANASQHPEIWIVRGRWADELGDRRGAARCYWEALARHPDHAVAIYRLSQLLAVMGRESEARAFAARGAELVDLQVDVASGWSPSSIRRASDRLESLGRHWESLGWSTAILETSSGGEFGWAQERVQRLRRSLQPDTPLVLPAMNLALKLDLSDWPLPAWGLPESDPETPGSVPAIAAHVGFREEAAAAGISFSFFNGADPAGKRAYMFEFSGGGIAVLDYDTDGWPDLYLTQGCPWPPNPAQQKYRDRLFRNLGNGRFEDVTEQAGLHGTGYGQGAAVGDIDNDGQPDLYVANIGSNQLYRNNGDGTFTDVSSASGLPGAVWTISTLVADLDGDGNPDLYDVNYLGGPTVFTDECFAHGGPVQCFPNQFPAETDQLRRNLGDGRFRDVSKEAGIVVPGGKGMGVICADFDRSRRLSLFITNDTTNNFFFLNLTDKPGDPPRFDEKGLLHGLAFSETGMPASCMGVAAGDVNGDDLLDLFVTNFHDEANNLFIGQADLYFTDQIRQSRLNDPGYQMEGWGAQFLDADLDGQLDLVVANGHLDDYPHSPGVNRMPVQFFLNVGAGKFADVAGAELGPYFEGRRLGRALALLDWNRDGKPDFGVTNVDAPFALLTNQTHEAGHYLAVHLRGTDSARDAIGTTVTLRSGQQRWTRQLTAGDGFSASNQRLLVFGLGESASVDELQIDWPSGKKQTFAGVPADSELVFIEGREAPFRLPK